MKLRYLVLLIPVFFIVFVSFDVIRTLENRSGGLRQEVLGEPTSFEEDVLTLLWRQKSYKVAWKKIKDPNDLSLIANFEEQISAREAKEENNCQFLASAGFYTTDNKPTGLFIADYKKSQEFGKNSLLNGIFSINDFATPRITASPPADRLRLAVQAGPLLIENSFEQQITGANTKEARRVVVATTGANEVYFLVFWDPESFFSGPKLTDLPQILKVFEAETGLIFADAMNLDGGTASTFLNNTTLNEAKPVGAFLCERE